MAALKKIVLAGLLSMLLGITYAQDRTPKIIQDGIQGLTKSPEYPGGVKAFYSYINKNFRLPEIDSTFTARLYVSFVVEKDGTMGTITILRDPGYGLGEETMRVLELLPEKWNPAEQDGNKVSATYNFPLALNFKAKPKKRKK